ncbi:MAG TPA: NAD-dependent epimerase/dehydratase family protein [Thermoleophilaceae bacterium]|nr:NAD-dependent epimerase/dehydratase family protein [Thermoleophilaceae bacterium]
MRPSSPWAGRSVLVTGAQGFIGTWLTRRLLEEQARVVVLKRPSTAGGHFAREGLDQRCEQVQIDLLDHGSILRALNEQEVEVVFHLAAQTIVGAANSFPLNTFEANVRGTYNLLEACRLLRRGGAATRVLVASSYHVYGSHDGRPYVETMELRPGYPYDVSKACADMIARSYAVTYELPVAVTRLANVYGGGDLNFSRLVPSTARALVAGERPVIRSDGSPERDYIYVEDAVEAYLAAARSLDSPELGGRAWNAGAGTATSVLEVVRRLIAASGRDLEPEVQGLAGPRDEIDRQWLDSTAIRDELGWGPRVSLDEGLASAYAWYERELASL